MHRVVIVVAFGLASCGPAIGSSRVKTLSFAPEANGVGLYPWGTTLDCPPISMGAVARWNSTPLSLAFAGGVVSGRSLGGEEFQTCAPPRWTIPAVPAPAASEVIEITEGRAYLRAVFAAPSATFQREVPVHGEVPVVVALRLALDSGTREGLTVSCEGLPSPTLLGVFGGHDEFSFSPATPGTHHCTVLVNYTVAAAECTVGDCTMTRTRVPVLSATEPGQFVTFDLVLP